MTLHRTKALLAAAATSTILLTAACGGGDEDAGAVETTEVPLEEPAESGEGGEYADGDYEASGSYSNPGGTSSVTVALTLADGVVSDVEVTPEASGTSGQFQREFVGGIDEQVVGRSLDEIDVSKVAGSSLTSGGFNAALEEIKADASA